MKRSTAGTVGLVLGVAATAFGAVSTATPAASAASLSCVSPPGRDLTSIVAPTACRAKADPSSNSAAHGENGVGFAEASYWGAAFGAGLGGGVGAAEARRAEVAAVAVGQDSVAIATSDHAGPALVLSGPDGYALAADPANVVCGGGPSLAILFFAARACITDGVTVLQLP